MSLLFYCFLYYEYLIKLPRYTQGDFMFLYRFVHRRRSRRRCRRRRRPSTLVHEITFEQLFGFLSFFGTIDGPHLEITWLDFGRFFSWPWPWICKVKYGICYISAKNGLMAETKRKANISIELKDSDVTIGFDLGHDTDLEFTRSNMEYALSQPKMVRLPRNEKQPYRLNPRPQIRPMCLTLAMTLTFEFSRSNMTLTFDPTHGFDQGFS